MTLMDFVRAIIRPIVTFGEVVITLWLVLQGREIPEWLLGQEAMLITWWFSDRHSNGNGGK